MEECYQTSLSPLEFLWAFLGNIFIHSLRPTGTYMLVGLLFFKNKRRSKVEKRKPIVALDFKSKEEALSFLALFGTEQLNVKIGMELFYSAGPDFVREVVMKGHKIFLDLKCYDIPNTVERTMTQLARLGVSMVNVHASGGVEMMEAALKGLEKGTEIGEATPLLIAVTQLTSRAPSVNEEELQLAVSQEESILNLAQLTDRSGLDGVVCSPLEAEKVKAVTHKNFLTVTPGIRLQENTIVNDDQVRITTPEKAAAIGSDYIVVGRPITKAENPLQAYQSIAKEWQEAIEGVRV